jgi:hypothetical protein
VCEKVPRPSRSEIGLGERRGVDERADYVMDRLMTGDQLAAVLKLADASKTEEGWTSLGQYTLTIHTAFNGASLSIAKIESVKVAPPLVYAKSTRGETHIVRLDDIFASTIDPSRETGRKAGFV